MSAIPTTPLRAPAPNVQVSAQDLPFWYPLSSPGSSVGTVTLTANQTGVPAQVTVDNDSEFELRALVATSTGPFSVTLTNQYIRRPLSPTPINGENIAGTALDPAFIPIPWRLARTSIVSALFNDRSGAPNTIQFALWGYKKFSNSPSDILLPNVLHYRKAISHVYMPDTKDLEQLQNKIPYWWPVLDNVAIGSQQAARSKVSMPQGSYATHLVASSSQAAGFVLQLFDTERGEMFEDQPTLRFVNHAGSAQRPFWLRKVYRLPFDGQIQCRVINLAKAVNTVQVVICGVRD